MTVHSLFILQCSNYLSGNVINNNRPTQSLQEPSLSLAKNVEFLRHFPKLNGFNGLGIYGRTASPAGQSPLVEISGFGTNPGALKMFAYVPEPLPRTPALVVVLHGRGQTASIRQMVARMVADHKIDPRRIYITGLSAGGAMTSVMLAVYPEVFAGGAIIAGLPFGIASNVREALGGMIPSTSRPAAKLGDLVRKASKHKGPWPKVSVWHGSADRTVNPGNANEIVKQWLDVHGLPAAPMSMGDVDGNPREVWWNADGETVVESYTITDMAHGTPLGLAGNDERYGAEGAFLIEAGISSSYHIAAFFGLTGRVSPVSETAKPAPAPKVVPSAATESLQSSDLAATLWSKAHKPVRQPKPAPREPKRRGIDVGAVITRALTAAGLMK